MALVWDGNSVRILCFRFNKFMILVASGVDLLQHFKSVMVDLHVLRKMLIASI